VPGMTVFLMSVKGVAAGGGGTEKKILRPSAGNGEEGHSPCLPFFLHGHLNLTTSTICLSCSDRFFSFSTLPLTWALLVDITPAAWST